MVAHVAVLAIYSVSITDSNEHFQLGIVTDKSNEHHFVSITVFGTK